MRNLSAVFCAAALGLATAVSAPSAAAQDYPSSPIAVVVHSAAGGGTDLTARKVVDILTGEGLVKQPMVVENRTGGSGAVAIQYMATQAVGNPYIIWNNTSTTALIQPRRANLPYTWEDFTPIAMLAQDPGVVGVSADSPYQSLAQLIEDAKANPKKVRVGISALGGSGHIIAAMLAQATGAEFSYVSFNSGGEAVAALLGGHVDVVCENPSELLTLLQAGRLRLIAATTDKRLEDFPDVPTAQEQGIDVSFDTGRFIFGPKGISPEVVTYWERVLGQMVETDAWKQYVKDNQMVPAFMIGEEFRQYLAAREKPMIDALISVGVIKQ